MFDRLTLVTAPASAALTLAEVKSHLRVDHADEDTLITALIADATAMIDGPDGIGFCMVAQTWRLTLDTFPACIRLPLRPAVSVSSLTYLDTAEVEQTLPAASYRVSIAGGQGVITPATGTAWPGTASVTGAIKVNFVAGTGVPAPLRQAMLLMIGDSYHNREASLDARSVVNPAIDRRLNPYRTGAVGA